MIVGIDIDDTMTNHCETWFQLYNEFLKDDNAEPLKLEDAYKWNFYDDWSEENKQKLMDAMKRPEYFERIKLFPKVVKVIQKIIDSGNKVIIISSTYKEYQDSKKKWLLKQIPILTEDDIVFTKTKELINVDVMIDDNLALASKFNCPFLLYREPWNIGRPADEYTNNIIIVGSWKDIEDSLVKLGAINILTTADDDETFTMATKRLVDGIKNAETDKEIAEVLNPYIRLWQQQGMLLGMHQINEATMLVVEDIIASMHNKDEKK